MCGSVAVCSSASERQCAAAHHSVRLLCKRQCLVCTSNSEQAVQSCVTVCAVVNSSSRYCGNVRAALPHAARPRTAHLRSRRRGALLCTYPCNSINTCISEAQQEKGGAVRGSVCAVVQLCAAMRAVVSGSVRGQVRQCMYATVCTSARGRAYVTGTQQCAAVRHCHAALYVRLCATVQLCVAVCGSVRSTAAECGSMQH
jgi:hypothetical protein